MFSHSHRIALPLFFILICLLKNAVPRPQPQPRPQPHVTPLIHYRSVRSPAFNPNMSMAEAFQVDLERSIARGSELWKSSSRIRVDSSDHFETSVSTDTDAFYAYLQVGSPEIGQYVIMDTGSSLFWIFCEPCTKDAPPIVFNPARSSSFQNEHCNTSDVCSRPSRVKLSNCYNEKTGRGCFYEVKYAKSYAEGYLGRDKVRFGSSIFDDVVFGCTSKSDLIKWKANGILGLAVGSFSLTEQSRSSRFGYCFGNISDINDESGRLLMGNGIEPLGYNTPLIIQGQYIINLVGIQVGGEWLDIDPARLQRNVDNYTGGVLIDTGSTYTYFPVFVLEKIHDKLESMIGHLRSMSTRITVQNYILRCYRGVITRDVGVSDFPAVLLNFVDEAVMMVNGENIFIQSREEVFCLAILPSSLLTPDNNQGTTMSLLGHLMQQHSYMWYDPEVKILSFQRMDNCAQLGV